MPIKAIVENLENVAEPLREFYREFEPGNGEPKKYVIDVSQKEIEHHPSTKNLSSAHTATKAKLSEAREKLEQLKAKFEDVDVDEYKRLLQEGAGDQVDVEKLKKDLAETYEAKFNRQIETLQKDRDNFAKKATDAESAMKNYVITQELQKAAVKHGVKGPMIEMLVKGTQGEWSVKDGNKVVQVDGDGSVRFNENAQEMTPDDYFGAMSRNNEYEGMFNPKQGSGTNFNNADPSAKNLTYDSAVSQAFNNRPG